MTQLTRKAPDYDDCLLTDTMYRCKVLNVDMALLVGVTSLNTGSDRKWFGAWIELAPDGSLGRFVTMHNYKTQAAAQAAATPHIDTVKVALGLGSPSYRNFY